MTHLLLHIKPVRCSPTTSQQKLQSVVRPPGRYEQRKRTFFLFGLFRTTRPLACVSCVRMYSLPNKCRSVLVSVLSLSAYPLGTSEVRDRGVVFVALVLLLMASAPKTLMECLGSGSGMVFSDRFKAQLFNLHLLEA